jgi:hypothetical protein
MKKIYFFLMFLFIIVTSCKKEDPAPDIAQIVSGSYTGKVIITTSTASKSYNSITRVNKTGDALITVSLQITGSGIDPLDLTNVVVSNGSGGIYKLDYKQPGTTITGTQSGTNLTYEISAKLSSGLASFEFNGSK